MSFLEELKCRHVFKVGIAYVIVAWLILQHKLGHKKEADAAMASLIADYRDNGLYQQAQVYAQWGDFEQSLRALNHARDIGDPGVSQIVADPLLDPLRGEPKFGELMAAVGFA